MKGRIFFIDLIIYQKFTIVKIKMKICAIICEFNPFHNGHKYLIEQAKRYSSCDAVLCIMSGSFTQRGEICVTDKYDRARHAILGGADCVIELPAAFAVAPAEIFAKGAIKILSTIPSVTTLAFGCESGNAEDFFIAANMLLHEDSSFKSILQENLSQGESYVRSYTAAFRSIGGNEQLISKPNNLLGLEYTKAILRENASLQILPIRRTGSNYTDLNLKMNYSSSAAIRKNINSPLVRQNVPDYVYSDLVDISSAFDRFKCIMHYDLVRAEAQNLRRIYGCSEGLENRLLALAQELPYDEIVKSCTSKRYSASRIRRILCANSLQLYQDDCERYLNADLYIKPLAVRKQLAADLLSALSLSRFPLITNFKILPNPAAECLRKDSQSYSAWKVLMKEPFTNNRKTNKIPSDYTIFI